MPQTLVLLRMLHLPRRNLVRLQRFPLISHFIHIWKHMIHMIRKRWASGLSIRIMHSMMVVWPHWLLRSTNLASSAPCLATPSVVVALQSKPMTTISSSVCYLSSSSPSSQSFFIFATFSRWAIFSNLFYTNTIIKLLMMKTARPSKAPSTSRRQPHLPRETTKSCNTPAPKFKISAFPESACKTQPIETPF